MTFSRSGKRWRAAPEEGTITPLRIFIIRGAGGGMIVKSGCDSLAMVLPDRFNHIYRAVTNGVDVPDWFWSALEVWHIRHRGTTISQYIFKPVREFALRQCLNMNCSYDG